MAHSASQLLSVRCSVVPLVTWLASRLSTMLGLHRGLFVATAAALAVLFTSVSAWVPSTRSSSIAANPLVVLHVRATPEQNNEGRNEDTIATRRRDVLRGLTSAALAAVAIVPTTASAKCTDETCREIGDRKVDEDMKANPTTALPSGVRYKVLRPPTGRNADVQVKDGSTVEIAFSISANGAYMYSRGFGFEKIDVGGKKQSDLGLDSLRVKIGSKRRDVPLGIEQAIMV